MPGSKIRLKEQGSSTAGGEPGDLYLKIKLAPHPVFSIQGDNLEADLVLSPWQAVLGDKVEVPTLDGSVRLIVPPQVRRGKKLRLAQKGLLKRMENTGDIIYKVVIDLPSQMGTEEKNFTENSPNYTLKGDAL